MNLTRLSHAFQQLLSHGYIADTNGQLAPWLNGLAHPVDADANGWLLSQSLLASRQQLSSQGEWVLALLALDQAIRKPWLQLLAARCKEVGLISDAQVLVNLVTELGAAAEWITPVLSEARLNETATAALERECLGHALNENAAIPALTRIIKVCYTLSQAQGQSLSVLPLLDSTGLAVQQNWCAGRLLALPARQVNGSAILSGGAAQSVAGNFDWLLLKPWALLLTMLVYAQDAWAAEGGGGLLLELPTGQAALNPSAIQVLVEGSEDDEVLCGCLAEFIIKVLAHLQMSVYPETPSTTELNQALSSVIGELLTRQLWHYREGSLGRLGHYQIHPQFADDCYRLGPSRLFNRSGKHLWQAVRLVAEQWYQQRMVFIEQDSNTGESL